MITKQISRSYSSIISLIPPERARWIFENPPLSKYKKPFDLYKNHDQLRRVYKHEVYLQILNNNRAIFVFQINGVTTPEYNAVKKYCASKDMIATRLRNSVFLHALDTYIQESSNNGGNSSIGSHSRQFLDPMKWMVSGPCCVVFSNANEEKRPTLIKDIVNILNIKGAKDKLLLIGGKVDNMLLSGDQVKEAAKLPSITQLRSQLLGLLDSPARQMVSVMQHSQKMLLLSLESHIRNNQKPPSSEENAN